MRPDYCPVGNEPCQSLCDEPCSKVQKRKPLTDKQILADETLRYYFGLNGGAGPVSKQGRNRQRQRSLQNLMMANKYRSDGVTYGNRR